MNPRERVLAILNRQPVDRIPVDLWHTPEVVAELQRHTGTHDEFAMWKALGLDKIVWVFGGYDAETGRTNSQVGAEAAGARTMWGVPLESVQAGLATYDEFLEPPMLEGYEAPADVEKYPFWPDADRFLYDDAEVLARRARQDFAVIGPWVSFFEIYCQLRGIEQALMDVAMAPDFVDAALDRIEAIQTEILERFLPRVADAIDLVFISDDIGGQNGLLISPDAWRRHLEPRMRRWCALVHKHGLRVFYHTDGGAEPLIGPLIDCGIDVLNPIQHACPGMQTDRLKREYGDRVIFHGGIDNQSVLPFGSPDDVRREVRQCLDTLGGGKEGYICASCHCVQPGTPVENILAMIETVRETQAG